MVEIQVEELTDKPTDYWTQWKSTARVMRLQVKHPEGPPPPNKLRFVCMADTHSLTPHMKLPVPEGDVFIHAGDFTRCGALSEVKEFNNWLGKLPHKHKIVIAGNHELSFDPKFGDLDLSSAHTGGLTCRSGHIGESPLLLSRKFIKAENKNENQIRCPMQEELTNCTYLEDSSVTIEGLKIYGTPWQPEFSGWAFNLPRGSACLEKWNRIPEDTHILVSHTPPLGFGDLCSTGVRVGCVELLNSVQRRIKPKYHIYGHIHEGYGVRSDGQILFINASTCDVNYLPCNPPVVFDVPLPS